MFSSPGVQLCRWFAVARHEVQHYTNQLAKDTNKYMKDLTALPTPSVTSEQVPHQHQLAVHRGRVTVCDMRSCHNHFTALFPGQPGWASARRELLDFMVQGKIKRGRHTVHPAGCHSIWTNQCPPPPSLHIFYRLTALPAAQPTASKRCDMRSWLIQCSPVIFTIITSPICECECHE